MDVITTLGRTMGFSFAAGVNLYATVAILGLASRFGWVSLPSQFEAFNKRFAFVIHDIKNLVSRLSLIVSNAAKHRHDAAFQDVGVHRWFFFPRTV